MSTKVDISGINVDKMWCRKKVGKKEDSLIGHKNSKKNYKNGQTLDKNWTTNRLK